MNIQTSNSLVSLSEAKELIASGVPLSVAGPEALLDQLPAGNWIGGTSSYFTGESGGVTSSEHLFVSTLRDVAGVTFRLYAAAALHDIMVDSPENGYSLAVMPSGSECMRRFAEESRFWPDLLLKPVTGWIAGIHLADLGRAIPKVYFGPDASKHADAAVVAHVSLLAGRMAMIETINIFERDERYLLRFAQTGFASTDCTINGKPGRLAELLAEAGNGDGRLPLIGDFGGASINVSIQSIDAASGRVALYAPVFPDVEYYLAKPVGDYAARFTEIIEQRRDDGSILFSCNCILNHLYGELEGRQSGGLQGPVTFGEIAYLLHNQTLVTLKIY